MDLPGATGLDRELGLKQTTPQDNSNEAKKVNVVEPEKRLTAKGSPSPPFSGPTQVT